MKCPGQDMQYWKEDAIYEVKCPKCGELVEFYKDDTTRICNNCRHRFVNPKMDFGCATYCQFAEQCLGTLPEEFVMQQDNLLKDKVAVEVKKYFKTDFKSIGFATRVAHYAEKIGKITEGVNLAAVLCSAYLLTIGHAAAASKNSEVTKKDLEREGPALAAEILKKLGANSELVECVCAIVANNIDAASDHSISADVVNDAYRLARLEHQMKEAESKTDLQSYLQSIQTAKARDEAHALYRANN